MTEVAGYIRVSTAQQIDGESLDNQKEQIKQFANQKGWKLVDIYADEGQSGAKIEYRTQLQKLVSDAKKGKFQIIVFYKLSRFARNAREYQNLSYELEQHNVSLSSVKEGIDPTTQTGKLISGILALFAEWEHETIKEQMAENRTVKWKEKRSYIGKTPLGYRWNKDKKEIEIVESEAALYKRMVKMYTKENKSYNDIVNTLNSEGVKSRNGKEWRNPVIARILRNTAYYGYHVCNQFEYEDSARGAGTKRTKKLKPASEHIDFPIPAIISKTEWDEILNIIEFRRKKSKRIGESTHEFFLRDVLYCKRCGGRIKHVAGNKNKDGSRSRYYACYWSKRSPKAIKASGHEKCELPYLIAEDVENAVWWQFIRPFKFHPDKAIGDIFSQEHIKSRIQEIKSIIKNQKSELAKNKRVNSRLYILLENPDLDLNEIHQKLIENKNERLSLESSLKEAEISLSNEKDKSKEITKFNEFRNNNKDLFTQVIKDLNHLCPDDKKILIESMVKNMKIELDMDYSYLEYGEKPQVSPFFSMRYNPDIIRSLAQKNKINALTNNSPDNSCTH